MCRGKFCSNCKYFLYDNSTGASDCNRADDIPENLFEKHFVDDEANCPFYAEFDDIDYPVFEEEEIN